LLFGDAGSATAIEISYDKNNFESHYIFHQSNKFIMQHLMNKIGLPAEKVPIILEKYGNTGGPSIPLTITQANLKRSKSKPMKLMLLGYGVGLSWASALIYFYPDAVLKHVDY
jgi:3-oxoacyl-[acyl-carrier-protein] synthase-3